MRNTAIAMLLVLAVACQQTPKGTGSAQSASGSAQQSATLSAEQLGELGAQIKKNPDQAQRLLADRGLSEASFEQQIRRVSENPDEAKKYAAAFKNASQ